MNVSSDNNTPAENKGKINRKSYLWIIGAATLIGVIGGYSYYYFIGCRNGCAIQSSPYLSMVWGGAIFYLLADMIVKPKKD